MRDRVSWGIAGFAAGLVLSTFLWFWGYDMWIDYLGSR